MHGQRICISAALATFIAVAYHFLSEKITMFLMTDRTREYYEIKIF